MRRSDARTGSPFGDVDLEFRVPSGHPLRVVRRIANEVLEGNEVLDGLSAAFERAYSPIGRASIPPERLFRALPLQAFYTIRSERQPMERLDFDPPFRRFVGPGIDDPVRDVSSYARNRDGFLEMDGAGAVPGEMARRQMSRDRFSVDGAPVDARASMESFVPKDAGDGTAPPAGGDLADTRAKSLTGAGQNRIDLCCNLARIHYRAAEIFEREAALLRNTVSARYGASTAPERAA